MTDRTFSQFPFKATGGTTDRTMPDRLAEVKNVKDFGAVGDGVADDSGPIQAAVNWTSGANRGTICFPPGTYYVGTTPITFNYDGDLSICFRGEHPKTVHVTGAVNGYIFDRHLATPNNTTGGRIFERLKVSNTNSAGGCIRVGSSIDAAIRDCDLSSHTNITTEDSAGNSSENTLIQNCTFSLGAGTVSGAHHIIIGGGGSIQNCALTRTDTSVRAYGAGLHASGNRHEVNNTAWLLGKDSAGTASGLRGFSITAATYEGNLTGIDFAGPCDGFYIGSHSMQGHDNTNAGQPGGGTGTLYSIKIAADCATNGVIETIVVSNWHEAYGVSIANATARTNLVLRNITATASGGGGSGWNLPTNAMTARIENCNTATVWTYSQLPTGGNILEGEEFDISDSNTSTWGATAAGGGSNRVRVRYNGTNYTVVGK